MRELEKVVSVVRKRSQMPVYTVLVIDATTGQNGMQQAREFNRALELDALIVTKLDGTAKGGIALAISHELGLPIIKIGVGEGIDDLRDFNAKQYVSALIGDFEEGDEFAEGDTAEVDLAADFSDSEGVTGEVAAAEDEPDAEEAPQVTPSPNEAADTQERPSMTWDEFCAMEDAQPKKKKKHFWEKW
jgi:fused signal recognition particle receptor